MSLEFTIDTANKIILCMARDTVSLEEVLNYHEELERMNHDVDGLIEYVDMGGLEEMHLNYQTAQAVILQYNRFMKDRVRGSIFYAPTELGFGMANMMASSAQAMAGDEKIHVLVVREPIAPENLHAKFDELLNET